MTHLANLAKAALALAREVPPSVLEEAADVVAASGSLSEARLSLATRVPHPHYRARISGFLKFCEEEGSSSFGVVSLGPTAVATTLATAAAAEHDRRLNPVEMVWTGPDPGVLPFRRTEQAILEVLAGATKRILLVSYAVYKIPSIREAIVDAARRGVEITVIIETPDLISGKSEYSTLRALGADVAAVSTVYYWPEEKRLIGGVKTGILHVKCVVADGRSLFLSSANLTEYAFTVNMELGVLITRSHVPRLVEKHFDGLIGDGTLERLE